MNYNDEIDDAGTGCVKGSNKDRVISFFYRKRYKIKLMKQYNNISVSNSIIKGSLRLNHNRINRVTTLADLKVKGVNYIEVDANSEQFDFDKYDYYIIKSSRKKGIGPQLKEQSIKGGLSRISSIKAKGLDRHISDTRKLVEDTQKELKSIKINLEYPVMHREDLSKMYHSIRENINDLKYEYELLKGETNNRSYAFEEAIKIMDNIDQYTESNIDKMDKMLKVATLELNKLSVNKEIKKVKEDVSNKKQLAVKEEVLDSNLYNKPLGYDEKTKDDYTKKNYVDKLISENIVIKEEKKLPDEQVIEKNNNEEEALLDNEVKASIDDKDEKVSEEKIEEMVAIKLPKDDIINRQRLKDTNMDIVTIKTYEEKIAYELQRQKEIIHKMYSKAGKVKEEVSKTYQVTGYGRLLSSFGNIAVGMVTLPLTKVRILNLTLGASLINKGVKKLKRGLDTKEQISINYRYEDLSEEIKRSKNNLEDVNYLITDSLEDLMALKQKFVQEFSHFEYKIPDYQRTLQSMDVLSDKLKNNQMKLNSLGTDLSKQEQKNKVMIKKMNNTDY